MILSVHGAVTDPENQTEFIHCISNITYVTTGHV